MTTLPLALPLEILGIQGTCPPLPCLPDGGGLELGESFALPRLGAVWELSPRACRTEPGPSHRGLEPFRSPQQPRSHLCSAHPPVAASLPLGGALGWLPAVAPMVHTTSREPGPGRGQVRRRLHPGQVDVQPRAIGPGSWIKSRQGGRISIPLVSSIRPPREPSEIAPSWGFRFLGPRIQ